MSYGNGNDGRVCRLTYWLYYVGIMVLTWSMYGWSIYEFIKFNLVPIVFGVVAPFIISIYFRVIASRRCRDIGWPAILPWISICVTIASGVIGGLQAGIHSGAALGTMGLSVLLAMVVGLVDFVFLIVIGCIAGKEDGSQAFSGRFFDDADGTPGLETGRASPGVRAQRIADVAPAAPAAPVFVQRGARGFGRRGLS